MTLLANEFVLVPKASVGGKPLPAQGVTFRHWQVLAGENVQINKVEGQGPLDVLVLGDMYSAESPGNDNAALVQALSSCENLNAALQMTFDLAGEFVVIAFEGDKYRVWNDACGQLEIYVEQGDQPWMASFPTTLRKVRNARQNGAEGSAPLQKLPPNHFYSSSDHEAVRYFPTVAYPVKHAKIEEAVGQLSAYLRGVMDAMARRAPLAMPITAGYDSRLLLAASPTERVTHFIYKHGAMESNHHDIVVGAKLAAAKGVEFKVLTYNENLSDADRLLFEQLHESRFEKAARVFNADRHYFSGHTMINGNIGEVARSYYGSNQQVTAKILAALLGAKGKQSEIERQRKWLASVETQYLGADNLLDLFYWEERMGNWAAKAKSEVRLVTGVVSPVNCHRILAMILGVDKKYRTYYRNQLFERTIRELDPRLSGYPYNPGLKSAVIKAMVALDIYGPYKDFTVRMKG